MLTEQTGQRMSRSNRLIIGGVDTHAATHHAAVIDLHGRLLADAELEKAALKEIARGNF